MDMARKVYCIDELFSGKTHCVVGSKKRADYWLEWCNSHYDLDYCIIERTVF